MLINTLIDNAVDTRKIFSMLYKHYKEMTDRLGREDVLLVGGCVRDVLLGHSYNPHDIDVTVAGTPKELIQSINKEHASFFATEKYGTMTVIPHTDEKKQEQQIQYEITPLRTESGYSDQRHPDQIQRSDSVVADAQRRDFTVNALYYSYLGAQPHSIADNENNDEENDTTNRQILQGDGFLLYPAIPLLILTDGKMIENIWSSWNDVEAVARIIEQRYDTSASLDTKEIDVVHMCNTGLHVIVDPTGGVSDMHQGILRAVGDPDTRLQEDALRIIRAVRFLNVLNTRTQQNIQASTTRENKNIIPRQKIFFDIHKDTWKSLKKNYFRLQFIPKERVKTELDKIMTHGDPFGAIALLDELNLLQYLFPAVKNTQYVKQPVRYHAFDVYTHSILVLRAMQQLSTDRLARYAALYHDVGKTEQYYSYEMGLNTEEVREIFGTWLNHVVCGVDMARKDFGELGFSNKEKQIIGRYVANHMKPGDILAAKPENRPKKVRRLLSEAGEHQVRQLFLLTIADREGQANPVQSGNLDEVQELLHILDDLVQKEGQFTVSKMDLNGNDIMKHFDIAPGPQIGDILHKAFERIMEDIANRNNKETILQWLKESE